MTEEHECEECGHEFTWCDDEVCIWNDEYNDGVQFQVWEIDCPRCGESCRVRKW